jgi:hypothetical protein
MAPLYATIEDCLSYTDGLMVSDEEAMDRIIERAEQDIDTIVGDWPYLPSGRKFDPELLGEAERDRLKRATCAQAEYRVRMGEAHFATADRAKVVGPDFRVEGELPRLGPQVMRELAGSGLIRTWRTVRPSPEPA